MSKEETKYFIQTWIPVWSLSPCDGAGDSGVPIPEEDPDAFFENIEDAKSEVDHNIFLQPENIYKIIKVELKDGKLVDYSYPLGNSEVK